MVLGEILSLWMRFLFVALDEYLKQFKSKSS